jgi:hypothetical protein
MVSQGGNLIKWKVGEKTNSRNFPKSYGVLQTSCANEVNVKNYQEVIIPLLYLSYIQEQKNTGGKLFND